MNMLLTSDLENYKFTNIYKAVVEGSKVYIQVLAEYKYFYNEEWLTIGRYDFETSEGKIIHANYKEYKWYKSFKSMYNTIFKANNNACMDCYDGIINKVKLEKTPQQRYNEIKKILTADSSNGIKEIEEELRSLFAEAAILEKSGQVNIYYL